MELSFRNGTFVSYNDRLNFQNVLDDFPTAKIIRIITYNISKNQQQDKLLELLHSLDADIQIITNVPSRMPSYYPSEDGLRMRNRARENIQIYISKLNPDNFPRQFTPFFNPSSHAKLIGTENIVYIGSANYSNESFNNTEAGVVIKDKDFIQQLYSEFFDTVKEESLSYFEEGFSAFRLFVFSLYAKFEQHHRKLVTDLYTDYERRKMVVTDSILLDISDLESLYLELDELDDVRGAADDTYEENSAPYNEELGKLKERFSQLSIEWLKEMISEDGVLHQLVAYNDV